METITNFLHQSISVIVPFAILLGLLIFVHELGHFLVAKYFGVRVEVFSLGFGKKIFKVTRGTTDYCLSLIPFGGYVKMFGDEPGADISAERRGESFSHKPVGQRIAVVLAGPLMNFFFAILLFFVIALIGESNIVPTLGDIAPTSAAGAAGFRDGDSILSVAGKSVRSWDDVKKTVEDSAKKNISFEIRRKTDGTTAQINVIPTEVPNKNILSSKDLVGEVEGLSFLSRASIIGVSDSKSPAGIAGLQAGDVVRSINGVKTESWRDLVSTLESERTKGEFNLEIQRGEDELAPLLHAVMRLPSALTKSKKQSDTLNLLGIESPDFYIEKVLDDSAAAAAGLKRGDKIVSAENQALKDWDSLVKKVDAAGNSERTLKLTLLRGGEILNIDIKPKKIKQMTNSGKEEEMFAVGVMRMLAFAAPHTTLIKASGVVEAFSIGVEQSVHWTKTTLLSFLRIFQNRVSAKSIGGPLMIGQLASETFRMGASPFLKIMAIISLNLFVLNLLPVPVLDGGHLFFYMIELVRGTPLSLKKMEVLQQVGLALLLALMVFALFNDVTRMLKFTW